MISEVSALGTTDSYCVYNKDYNDPPSNSIDIDDSLTESRIKCRALERNERCYLYSREDSIDAAEVWTGTIGITIGL